MDVDESVEKPHEVEVVGGEEDADFPYIKLDEFLENFDEMILGDEVEQEV